MFVTLPRDVEMADSVTHACVTVRKGRRELEEIPNPLGFREPLARWWVLRRTRVGAAKGYWLAVLGNGKVAQA